MSKLLFSTGGKGSKGSKMSLHGRSTPLPPACGSMLKGIQECLLQYPATVAGAVWSPQGSSAGERIISSPCFPSQSIFKHCFITPRLPEQTSKAGFYTPEMLHFQGFGLWNFYYYWHLKLIYGSYLTESFSYSDLMLLFLGGASKINTCKHAEEAISPAGPKTLYFEAPSQALSHLFCSWWGQAEREPLSYFHL